MGRTILAGALALLTLGGGASATQADLAAIKEGCAKSTNWTDAACTCFAGKAAELTDGQQAFLAATLNQDRTKLATLAMSLSQAEIMQATMFPTQAGPGCQ